MTQATNEDLLTFNGINGATGEYGFPQMSPTDFAALIQGEKDKDFLNDLRQKRELAFPVKEGVDPADLSQSGWGVIFTDNADPAIKEALGELLNLRLGQAGEYFRIFEGTDGYRAGESKRQFLGRHGVGSGVVDPAKGVPYYLLLVGGPEEIPFKFQFQLDVQFAVGRIYFEMLQEYANYASSVVTAEQGSVKLPRRASFFGVTNDHDRATQLSSQSLVTPVAEKLTSGYSDWQIDSYMADAANKAQLQQLLGGDQTPALLFTASHGMEFPVNDARQIPHQGAILCQDWPGPRRWRKPIPQDYYFAGDDLDADANLLGMIAFSFACFGAGTPQLNEFSFGQKRNAIAPNSFMANLPTSMLNRPKGGALAVVGHVERAWGYSFLSTEAGTNTTTFESALESLLYGDPVGLALEDFDMRFAELATDLTGELEEVEYLKQEKPEALQQYLSDHSQQMVSLWTEHNDARNYIIIGDPAVRLPLATDDEPVIERPTITINDVSAIAQNAPPITAAAATPEPAAQTGASAADVDYGLLDSFRQTQSNVGEAMGCFADRLGTFLTEALNEATSLEVATYTSDNLTGVKYQNGQFTGPAELRALTRIEIDGDTSVVIPTTDGETDIELWTIHMEMVKQAQTSRTELIQTAVTALSSLATMWKPG